MRANEFISEAGFLNTLGNVAATAGHELGLYGDTAHASMKSKLRGGQLAKNASSVLSGKLTKMMAIAKKNNISLENPRVKTALENTIETTFDGLHLDIEAANVKSAMNEIVQSIERGGSDLKNVIYNAVKPLAQGVSDQAARGRGGKPVTLDQAVVGAEQNTQEPTILFKQGGQWRKFIKLEGGKTFKEVDIPRNKLAEIDRDVKSGKLKLGAVKAIALNNGDIVLADKKLAQKTDQMARQAPSMPENFSGELYQGGKPMDPTKFQPYYMNVGGNISIFRAASKEGKNDFQFVEKVQVGSDRWKQIHRMLDNMKSVKVDASMVDDQNKVYNMKQAGEGEAQ